MKEIVTFSLNGKEYGIEISGMQSLENYKEISPFPDAPEGVAGTVKIRDEIYPVFNIREKLDPVGSQVDGVTEVTEETKFLLLKTSVGDIACVVDSVGKVFRAEGDDIQQFPSVARTKETTYIDFVARRNNALIVVLKPDELLTEEQKESIQKIDFTEVKEER